MAAFEVYRKLGADRIAAGDVTGALSPLRTALRLRQDDEDLRRVLVQALFVAGEQARLAGRLEEAKGHFAEAAATDPDNAVVWNGLGQCHVALGTVADGAACYRRALALRPDEPAVLSNLGNALVRLLDYAGAEAAYVRAVELAPDHAEFRYNRALHLLRSGRLADGWDLFAARLARPGKLPDVPGPLWDGSDPAGRTIAVWSEQGIGDELMFGTCIPGLATAAGHVIWECAPKLQSLLARSLPQLTVVARPENAGAARTAGERFPWAGSAGPIDGWIGSGALPQVFRREPADFAGSGGYLSADPARRQRAADWLASLPRPRVGICWRGAVVNATRSLVYAPPQAVACALASAGATPVLLQYGATSDELAAFGAPVAAMPELDLFDDLESVAGLIAELDLVISAATSVAELAGALAVPVWRFGPRSDWTLLGQPEGGRPWFSSMRVFGKPDCDPDWSPVFAAMAAELSQNSRLLR